MESNMFIEGPELCVFRLCGFVPISCGSPLSCTGLVIVCQSSRPNCTHNPSTWNEAVLDDSASSLPSIKTSCFLIIHPCISLWIYIYILGTSDLGLVKDTLGWTSPISSCFRPPCTSPNSSGVRMRLETMLDFFVRHGPLVKPGWHRN